MSYGFKEIMRQIDDARKVQDMSRDPFGSHDGMDIDPRTAVVETCGYGYRKAQEQQKSEEPKNSAAKEDAPKKEYGIDQLMANLSDETPETVEDGPGDR